MQKIILALSSIFISQILPLLGKPELILNKNNIFIMIVNAAIWLTQPPVSSTETIQNRNKDKFSVLLILLFSIGSIIASVIDWAYFKNNVVTSSLQTVGVILLTFGVLLRVWSIRILGRFFTATIQIKEDHVLITKGPYAFIRHPSYLGAWVAIAGTTIFFNSYTAFGIALFGMGISYYIRIDLEEKALIEVFGQNYKNYQKKVKKIIPFVW